VVPRKADSGNISGLPCRPNFQGDVEDPFDDAELDDGLDPAMREEIDREVADFAMKLNLVWPERMRLDQDQWMESHVGAR